VSEVPEALILNGPLDPFEPLNPDDHLNHLDPLAASRYTIGFCETSGCTYPTYLYAYCSACCRSKWQAVIALELPGCTVGVWLCTTAVVDVRNRVLELLAFCIAFQLVTKSREQYPFVSSWFVRVLKTPTVRQLLERDKYSGSCYSASPSTTKPHHTFPVPFTIADFFVADSLVL